MHVLSAACRLQPASRLLPGGVIAAGPVAVQSLGRKTGSSVVHAYIMDSCTLGRGGYVGAFRSGVRQGVQACAHATTCRHVDCMCAVVRALAC